MKNKRIYLGCFLIVGILAFFVYLFFSGLLISPEAFNFIDLPKVGVAMAVWANVGGLGIWIWMFTNFFRGGPGKYRALWGWCLFFGTFVAASIYFILIYIPNNWTEDEHREGVKANEGNN